MKIEPFTICLGQFRFLESKEQKIRPVIVAGRPHGKRHILMAIPITSSAKAEAVDIVLEEWQDNGLLKPSVARVHRLSAVLQQDLLESIGTVDEKHQKAIKSSLKEMLGL